MNEREPTPNDLPADNATRIAIFDAMSEAAREGATALTLGELHDRVIARLRVLVPRELHNVGEREYVSDKAEVCRAAGLLDDVSGERLALTATPPQVRFPDERIRDYPAGLEQARERLDVVNSRLRESHFNVCNVIPSTADAPDSPAFRRLVASMREHGFWEHAAIYRSVDGTVIDGRARRAAAEEAGIDVEWFTFRSEPDRIDARRRDTPLQRLLVALDANATRLTDDDRRHACDAVATVAGRPWDAIAADLSVTRVWRSVRPRAYVPRFQVKLVPLQAGDQPRIHVTTDGRVMVRSLLEAAGLADYKANRLWEYVPWEMGKSDRSGGPKARFARIADLAHGIPTMLADRRSTRPRLKVEPGWDQICVWLEERSSEQGRPSGAEHDEAG